VVCNINHWQSLGQASLATSPNQFQRQKIMIFHHLFV
jgi:hypothetical protein